MDVIVDVDGTLADCEHRRYLVQRTSDEAVKFKPDWPRFHDLAHLDTPIIPVIELVRALWISRHRIIITTGRPDSHTDMLVKWLRALPVNYDDIYMRDAGDTRPDDEVKAEMLARMRLNGYNPVMAIDDRQKVVDFWRRAGLICLQVAPGDF